MLSYPSTPFSAIPSPKIPHFAFTDAITSEKDPLSLAKIIKVQLKELFDIDEYAILDINMEKGICKPLLYDVEVSPAKPDDFPDLLQKEIAIDLVVKHVVTWQSPEFLSLSRAARKHFNQLLGVPIRIGQETIAVMIFSHENYDKMRPKLGLFKSILSQIAIVICNIIAHGKIASLQLEKQKNTEANCDYTEIIGQCPTLQQIFRLITQVASADSTVLILGKTGTGKELAARAIHNNSPRKSKPMVKVNCAALPAHLIESELFGHERGSFTGAIEKRIGKFEQADGGTLFLDEIGEMPCDLQIKLLRALQEREIERVGGKSPIKIDVRIIAATNRDLEMEVAEGRFRSDLYYRLNTFPIILPELKDRKEDIPLLATHFIHRLAGKTGRKIKGISKEALQDMIQYDWPGNIRELEHLIERSMLLSNGDMLEQIQLPGSKSTTGHPVAKHEFIVRTMKENEKEYIVNMLQYCQGRIGGSHGAAALMGIPPSTLFSKMKKLNITKAF